MAFQPRPERWERRCQMPVMLNLQGRVSQGAERGGVWKGQKVDQCGWSNVWVAELKNEIKFERRRNYLLWDLVKGSRPPCKNNGKTLKGFKCEEDIVERYNLIYISPFCMAISLTSNFLLKYLPAPWYHLLIHHTMSWFVAFTFYSVSYVGVSSMREGVLCWFNDLSQEPGMVAAT